MKHAMGSMKPTLVLFSVSCGRGAIAPLTWRFEERNKKDMPPFSFFLRWETLKKPFFLAGCGWGTVASKQEQDMITQLYSFGEKKSSKPYVWTPMPLHYFCLKAATLRAVKKLCSRIPPLSKVSLIQSVVLYRFQKCSSLVEYFL